MIKQYMAQTSILVTTPRPCHQKRSAIDPYQLRKHPHLGLVFTEQEPRAFPDEFGPLNEFKDDLCSIAGPQDSLGMIQGDDADRLTDRIDVKHGLVASCNRCIVAARRVSKPIGDIGSEHALENQNLALKASHRLGRCVGLSNENHACKQYR